MPEKTSQKGKKAYKTVCQYRNYCSYFTPIVPVFCLSLDVDEDDVDEGSGLTLDL